MVNVVHSLREWTAWPREWTDWPRESVHSRSEWTTLTMWEPVRKATARAGALRRLSKWGPVTEACGPLFA